MEELPNIPLLLARWSAVVETCAYHSSCFPGQHSHECPACHRVWLAKHPLIDFPVNPSWGDTPLNRWQTRNRIEILSPLWSQQENA